MDNQHLVAFEYGSGTVWGYVEAGSPAEVTEFLPEVDVYETAPAWMDEERLGALRQEAVPVAADGCLDELVQRYPRY